MMIPTITPAGLVATTLEDLRAAVMPGGIERQEKEGQTEFVSDQTLPIVCDRALLESIGFVFGEATDEIFVSVEFPSGWKKRATDHSMHSDLLDAKGNVRGHIFYKAAFYDRSASLRLASRFSITTEHIRNSDPDIQDCVKYIVKDRDAIVYESDVNALKIGDPGYWDKDKTTHNDAKTWLVDHYPDWENPLTYWEET